MKSTSAEDFIRIWNACTSIREVADRTGLAISSVKSKASMLRKRGVPVRAMHETKRLDVAKLSKLARDGAA